ncbi:MAG: HAD hydrolase-like protein [bacterium]|nr:HAD hydrolase-like protein [bacterium]
MLREFLNKYDTVIFDMDGVMTSEQNYWNSAALTVWEYLHLNTEEHIHINPKECMKNLKKIRAKVFCNDELISVLKNKGVNSNWDLGYVTVLLTWIVHGRCVPEDFGSVLEYAGTLGDNILDEYDRLADKAHKKSGFDSDWMKRGDLMWNTMHLMFQEWFLGDELFKEQYGHTPAFNEGKPGLLFSEEPIVDKEKLTELLRELSESKRVCTGTGRPYIEILQPVTDWGIRQYFAEDGLCNYNHVAEAERKLGNNALTKPHPYMFLKALYGTDYDDEKIINGDYDSERIKRTIIVGDAGSDILAAKAMGADFCAVLTGVNGKAARRYFENLNSEYILDSVTDMLMQ